MKYISVDVFRGDFNLLLLSCSFSQEVQKCTFIANYWCLKTAAYNAIMSGNLTDEQRRKIDENRRKALEKRAARLNHSKQPNNPTLTLSKNLVNTDSFGSSSSHSIARQSNSTKNTVSASKDASFDVGRSIPGQASKSSFNESTFTTTTTTQSGNETSTTQTTSIQDFVSKFARPGSSKSSFSKSDKGKVDNRPEQTQGNDKVCGAPNFGASKDVKVVKGTCVLISKNRFAVKAGYHAQLIGMFKTIPSRSYGELLVLHFFQRG